MDFENFLEGFCENETREEKLKIFYRVLSEKYPFLRVKNSENQDLCDELEINWFSQIPDGWAKAFGLQLVDELNEVLKKADFQNDYSIFQIKEKFGCYDSETEVLTKSGWKYFKDLTYDDDIATLDKDGETLIYQKPIDIISYDYSGKMYQLQNRGINLLVTPNHNLYLSKGSYYNSSKENEKRTYEYDFYTPDILFGKDKRFKKGCTWIGNPINNIFTIPGYEYSNFMLLNNCIRNYKLKDLNFNLIPFLRFLGFYIAEGYTCIRKGQGSDISISYNSKDEEELVCKLISDLGFSIRNAKGQKRIGNKTLAYWLKENCGHLALNKKVPEFIKNLSPLYIEEFLKYLFIGDGHKSKTSNILTTISKRLSDDVQELLLKCGYAFSEFQKEPSSSLKVQGKHKTYNINWLKLTEVEIENSKVKDIPSFREEWVDYCGKVFCATVPNHLLYIRRSGKGIWCGNSLRWYDNGVPQSISKEYEDIINKYEDLSYKTCIICGKPADGMTKGWICPYCKSCADEKKYKIYPYSN